MASDHYTPVKPVASSDGETADAADINNISDAVESAFETLEAEIDTIALGGLVPEDETVDTENFIGFFSTATGSQVIQTNTSFKFNAADVILTVDTMNITGGSITDTSGAIDFGNENLSTTGTLTSGTHTIGTLVLAAGSITDTGGSISFGDENLSTTGTLASGTHTIGTLVLAAGSITDTTNAIDFGNEALSTTGTLASGTHTIGTLVLAAGSITDTTNAIDFGNEALSTTGTLASGTHTIGTLVLAAGSITDTGGTIDFGNEIITTTGALTCGTFTSTGINDTANGERVKIADTIMTIGAAGSVYTIQHKAQDQRVSIAGGNAVGDGGSIHLYGSTHATLADDFILKDSSDNVIVWDNSAGELELYGGSLIRSVNLVLSGESGSELATFTKDVAVGNDIKVTGDIYNSVDNDSVTISGGNADTSGGNIIMYGGSTASVAGDINIRSGSNPAAYYDQSLAEWRIYGLLNLSNTTGQIKFPASPTASSDANTLDTYAEGSWTPVLGGTGGQSGQSYTTQSGTYVKIGKMVFIQAYLVLTDKGTIDGDLEIQGLPFNIGGLQAATVGYSLGITLTDTSYILHMYKNGNTTVHLKENNYNGTGSGTLTTSNLDTAPRLVFSMAYIAAS